MHLSPLRRRADAAATTPIPLTTTRGSRPMHVLITSRAEKAFDEVTAKHRKRRRLSVDSLQQLVKPPPPLPPPPTKLTPIESLQFKQLRGQFTHEQIRAMRSFLISKRCNIFPSEHIMRLAEKELSVEMVAFCHPVSCVCRDWQQLLACSSLALSLSLSLLASVPRIRFPIVGHTIISIST